MAAFIPALLGLGSSLAGGIGGLVTRRKARKELEAQPLASRALAAENARNIQRQALSQRTTNPMAALRSASQLGAQERQAGNFAAAREQGVRNQQIAQLRQGEAGAIQGLLGSLGGAGATLGAQLIGSSAPEAGLDPAAVLAQKQEEAKAQTGALAQQAGQEQFAQQVAPLQAQQLPVEPQEFSGGPTFGLQTPAAQPTGDATQLSIEELLRRRLGGGGGL